MTEVETELLKVQTITRDRCLVTGLNLALASDPVEVTDGLYIDRELVQDQEFQAAAHDARKMVSLHHHIRCELETRAGYIRDFNQLKKDDGSARDLDWLDTRVSRIRNQVELKYAELEALAQCYDIELDEDFQEFVKSSLRRKTDL